MTGKPVFAASEREKVLFLEPATPVTRTRLPIFEAASLMDISVPQGLYRVHQLGASSSLRREGDAVAPRARDERRPPALQGNDDLAGGVAFMDEAHRLGCVGKRERLRNQRRQLAGFGHTPERLDVFALLLPRHTDKALSCEHRDDRRAPHLATDTACPVAATIAPDDHERSVVRQCAPELAQWAPAGGVDDHVPLTTTIREVLARVVDHVDSAERADHVGVLSA